MECDSVHSTIERSFKNQNVYSPSDYYVFVRSARRHGAPYRVHVLETGDIMDFKTAAKRLVRNKNKDDDGGTVNWLKVKWFRYDPTENGSVLFKYDYDEDFRRIAAAYPGGRRKRSVSTSVPQVPQVDLKPLYNGPQPISVAK